MAGLSLPDLDWLDLRAVVHHSPRTSALRRSVDPECWVTAETSLLRDIEHSLRILRWFQTRDGLDGVNRPKPILLTEAERRAVEPDQLAPLPIPDMLAWLGWTKPSPN